MRWELLQYLQKEELLPAEIENVITIAECDSSAIAIKTHDYISRRWGNIGLYLLEVIVTLLSGDDISHYQSGTMWVIDHTFSASLPKFRSCQCQRHACDLNIHWGQEY